MACHLQLEMVEDVAAEVLKKNSAACFNIYKAVKRPCLNKL